MNNNIENNGEIPMEAKSPFGKRSLDIAAVIIAIAVGAAFALLVIKDFIGLNTFVFCLIAIAGVGYMLYKDDNLDVKNFIFSGGSFLVYASVFFRLEQEIYTALTFPTLLALLIITTIFSSKSGAKMGLATFLFRLFGPIARMDKIFIGLSVFRKNEKKQKHKYKQVLFGILISIGLLAIVIPLMMSAEAAFEKLLENIIEKINIEFEIQRFIGKTIAGTAVAMVFCGFLYTFTKGKMIGTFAKDKAVQKEDNHTMIITVLSIMGVVFLAFAIVQFNSLFISTEALVENTTFARTARDGYFQLVVLSVINFLLVLACTKMQRGSNKAGRIVIKILTTYFTVLNAYLLASSAYHFYIF